MNWKEYQGKLRNFQTAMFQAQLTTLAAGAALEDIPRNLPAKLQKGLREAFQHLSEELGESLKEYEGRKAGVNIKRKPLRQPQKKPSKAFEPLLMLFGLSVKNGRDPLAIDFTEVIYRQQLVMVVAHLEAFVGDSLRAICFRRPEILRGSQKQISWNEALSYKNRSDLFSGIVDSYVSAFRSAKGVRSIVETLSKELGLEINYKHSSFELFSKAEQVRHLIVHAGGIVDNKFKSRTGIRASIGSEYRVTSSFLESATNAALAIGQILFEAVEKKFYEKSGGTREAGISLDLTNWDFKNVTLKNASKAKKSVDRSKEKGKNKRDRSGPISPYHLPPGMK